MYSGNGNYSGIVPPGYGPWPLTDAELKSKYQKFDLPKAKKLMAEAGQSKGFSVKMTTFATPLDYPQISAVIKSQLKAINIDVNIVAQEAGTFAANNGAGNFDWDLTGRGMRGDIDGYMAEFHPATRSTRGGTPCTRTSRPGGGSATARSSSTPPSASRSTRAHRASS